MKALPLIALCMAGCAANPYAGMSNQQLREMNVDAGGKPALETAAPMMEAAVKAKLKDPDSADFQWPHDLRLGDYKPFLTAPVHGWYTCGSVNAKNGFGGYAGRTAVIVVIANGQVAYADIDSGQYHQLANECARDGMPVL